MVVSIHRRGSGWVVVSGPGRVLRMRGNVYRTGKGRAVVRGYARTRGRTKVSVRHKASARVAASVHRTGNAPMMPGFGNRSPGAWIS